LHSEQRYETCGDWLTAHGHVRHVMVSDMGDEDYAFLVAVHEVIEAWLCTKRGISQQAVDAFDMGFEQNRDLGDETEPGDSRQAPYFSEHQFATMIEKLVATELGVDWDHYDQTVL